MTNTADRIRGSIHFKENRPFKLHDLSSLTTGRSDIKATLSTMVKDGELEQNGLYYQRPKTNWLKVKWR